VNEITGISGGGPANWPTPAYDPAGNMTSGPKGDSPTTKIHMKWDAWNRLTECRADSSLSPGSPGALIANYSYDGRNYRIRKSVAGEANYNYYYNDGLGLSSLGGAGWQIVEERKNESANPYAQYVWDLRYIDSPVCRFRDENTDGQDIETLYYLNDVNFNVTALVDGTAGGGTFGSVVERYVYDPYGKPTVYSLDWSSTVSWNDSKKNEILFCGYCWDFETGKYKARSRGLDFSLGRWDIMDLKGITKPSTNRYSIYKDEDELNEFVMVDGPNLYLYVRGNPIVGLDPYGRWTVKRNGQAWALATAEKGDTMHSLAQRDDVRLDENEFLIWARPTTPAGRRHNAFASRG